MVTKAKQWHATGAGNSRVTWFGRGEGYRRGQVGCQLASRRSRQRPRVGREAQVLVVAVQALLLAGGGIVIEYGSMGLPLGLTLSGGPLG